MEVYLNRISGYASAITAMYQSKRNYTPELEAQIYSLESMAVARSGKILPLEPANPRNNFEEFIVYLDKVCKIGKKHITLLRYIDLEFSVVGLHRGAQDDFDAHAKRLDNRIIRASTRLSKYGVEKSDWYKDKIITTEEALDRLHIELPKEIVTGDGVFVKTPNGYVREDYENNKDVLRGLYRLSIPSNFSAKVNLTEFAHILKLRDKNSPAAPELQDMVESLLSQITDFCPLFTREFFYSIEN